MKHAATLDGPLLVEPWMDDAKCAYTQLWDTLTEAQQIQICEKCPVRAECLDFADRTEGSTRASGLYGVYGGLPPTKRHTRRVQQRARNPKQKALNWGTCKHHGTHSDFYKGPRQGLVCRMCAREWHANRKRKTR